MSTVPQAASLTIGTGPGSSALLWAITLKIRNFLPVEGNMKKTTTLILLAASAVVAACGYGDDAEPRPYNHPHADLVIELGNPLHAYHTNLQSAADLPEHPAGRIVFGHMSGYLPTLEIGPNTFTIEEIIPRPPPLEPSSVDLLNRYAYVRLIESTPERAVVHFRYFQNVRQTEPHHVVHEIFTIDATGQLTREIKTGTRSADEWNVPTNVATYAYTVDSQGFHRTSHIPPDPTVSYESITGNPILNNPDVPPSLWFRFDEALANVTYESLSGTACDIIGHKSLWRAGVSGTALQFDGWFSQIRLPAEQAPVVSDALTIEAWIAIGASPQLDSAPIVQHGKWGEQGYYLGITPEGEIDLAFSVDAQWERMVTFTRLEPRRWYAVAARVDLSTNIMAIFLNGEKIAEDVTVAGTLDPSEADLIIGHNSRLMPAIEGPIDEAADYPSYFGFDGLIDEVRIHTQSLTDAQILQSFTNTDPGPAIVDAPDLPERRFPANPEGQPAAHFGAEYTTLPYHDAWDNLWRLTEYADVVVSFETLPVRYVFWHGLRYGPGLVTENGKWAGDQGSENYQDRGEGVGEGCMEYIMDREKRFSHVRLLENTPARVVVHWRYAMVDSRYRFPTLGEQEEGDWAEEYWTIYPDGIAIRHLTLGRTWADSWVESMFFTEPYAKPEDTVELRAFSVVKASGEVRTHSWENTPPRFHTYDPMITMINLKSEYRPFNVYPGENHNPEDLSWPPDFYPSRSAVYVMEGSHADEEMVVSSQFHWWTHFPVSQIISDGIPATNQDRAGSSSLVHGVPNAPYLLYGFSNQPPDALIALAQSWRNPPKPASVTGGQVAYDFSERAYAVSMETPALSFVLNAGTESPVHNLALVVDQWPDPNLTPVLVLNGRTVSTPRRMSAGVRVTLTSGSTPRPVSLPLGRTKYL
jgi:hypothetical protein